MLTHLIEKIEKLEKRMIRISNISKEDQNDYLAGSYVAGIKHGETHAWLKAAQLVHDLLDNY